MQGITLKCVLHWSPSWTEPQPAQSSKAFLISFLPFPDSLPALLPVLPSIRTLNSSHSDPCACLFLGSCNQDGFCSPGYYSSKHHHIQGRKKAGGKRAKLPFSSVSLWKNFPGSLTWIPSANILRTLGTLLHPTVTNAVTKETWWQSRIHLLLAVWPFTSWVSLLTVSELYV